MDVTHLFGCRSPGSENLAFAYLYHGGVSTFCIFRDNAEYIARNCVSADDARKIYNTLLHERAWIELTIKEMSTRHENFMSNDPPQTEIRATRSDILRMLNIGLQDLETY